MAGLFPVLDPELVWGLFARALDEMTPQSGTYLLSIFRFESMIFEAQKVRFLTAVGAPHDEEAKQRIRLRNRGMNKFERARSEVPCPRNEH